MNPNFDSRITLEPGKRGGKPCIRGMRITVYDALEYLASGMSQQEVLDDFPYLVKKDILASLAFAARRERTMAAIPADAAQYSPTPSALQPPTGDSS